MNGHALKKKILVIFLGLFFSFIIFEVFLRLFAFDPATFFSSSSKPKGAYTIMTLGNSHTYGTGAPAGLSYPAQLEKMLNSQREKKYHVVNRGLRNINSTFIRESIESWIKEDQPDLVFIMVGEPNSWNRYGYWNYLKGKNIEQKAGTLEKFDFLRMFSTYKFIELLLNRDESWFGSSDYSNTFKGYKKVSDADKLQLGYIWIGALEESDSFDFRSLTPEQGREAIEMLKFVWDHDKNTAALRLMAEYQLTNKVNFLKGLDLLQQVVRIEKNYCFPCLILINKFQPRAQLQGQMRLGHIRSMLEKKPNKIPYNSIMEFLFAVEDPKKPLAERMKLAEAMSIANPGSIRALNVIFHAGARSHTPLYIEALKRTLAANPLATTGDLAQKIYGIRKINPQYTKESEEIFAQMEAKFQGTSFQEIAKVNDVVGEWVIDDINAIVATVLKSGARAVVQNYPRVRSGPPRVLDDLIRKWWDERKDRTNVDFMDVNKLLFDKFEKGGDYYYATDLGLYDNHLNERGYQEIANLMMNYVPAAK